MENLKTERKKYWNKVWNGVRYNMVGENDAIIQLINHYIPNAKNNEECFEIGCCPCSWLSYLGKRKNYIINGIDYSDRLNASLINWLKRLNIKIGQIEKANFFDVIKDKKHKKYDLVCSFGFIEHFKEYEKVIRMHDPFVKNGGYLVITVPNYLNKINYGLRKFYDYDSLKTHYIPSMDVSKWPDILNSIGGGEASMIYCF